MCISGVWHGKWRRTWRVGCIGVVVDEVRDFIPPNANNALRKSDDVVRRVDETLGRYLAGLPRSICEGTFLDSFRDTRRM